MLLLAGAPGAGYQEVSDHSGNILYTPLPSVWQGTGAKSQGELEPFSSRENKTGEARTIFPSHGLSWLCLQLRAWNAGLC